MARYASKGGSNEQHVRLGKRIERERCREFLHDIVAAANFGLLSGSLERLEAAVSEWRETAHVLRDPELRERLLTPILDGEFEDAPRPGGNGDALCTCDRFREAVAREYGEITDLEGLIAPGCVAHH